MEISRLAVTPTHEITAHTAVVDGIWQVYATYSLFGDLTEEEVEEAVERLRKYHLHWNGEEKFWRYTTRQV